MEFLPLILLSGLQVGCVYAMMALSYFVIINATGILNFAQGEWMMLSAVLGAALITAHLPYPLAVLAAIAGATGIAAGGAAGDPAAAGAKRRHQHPGRRPARHPRRNPLRNGPDLRSRGGAAGRAVAAAPIVLGDSLFVLPQTLFVFAVTAATFGALWLFLHRTTFGRSFRIAAIDPLGAQIVGVDLGRVRFAAFAIGGLIAAILAWLYGPLYAAGYLMGEAPGVKGFIALIIGGLVSPLGALTGGLMLGLFEVATAYYIGSLYSEGIAFVMLMLFLFVRPQGLIASRWRAT